MSETPVVKRSKKAGKFLLLAANIIVLAGLGFSSVFFYLKYKNLKATIATPDQRIAKYEKEISKSFALPVGEKATLADVKSAADLKKDEANKEFFKDAADGDVLLVYSTSKQGILYRPTTKKIIKSGPVAFKQQIATELIGAKADRDTVTSVLKAVFASDVSVTTEIDAKTPITGGTIVVDATGKNADLAKRLATELKGKVGNAPEGQTAASAAVGVVIYAGAAGL